MAALIEIPNTKWPQLRDLYSANWPYGMVPYCILDTHISYPALAEQINFKVYCADGEMTNGMIAIVDSNNTEPLELMIHPINGDTKAIETVLLSTDKIAWSRNIMIPSANMDVIDCLERIKEQIGVNVNYDNKSKAYKHFLSKNSKKFDNVVCPSNTYIGPLKPEHLNLVDKTWTYHSTSSYRFFELLMKNDLTYVLYSNEDEPLAWATINPEGALTHLYCLEAHRRKGYSEYIIKYIANDSIRQGRNVLAYTIVDNVKPQALFTKLGFEILGYDNWVFVNK